MKEKMLNNEDKSIQNASSCPSSTLKADMAADEDDRKSSEDYELLAGAVDDATKAEANLRSAILDVDDEADMPLLSIGSAKTQKSDQPSCSILVDQSQNEKRFLLISYILNFFIRFIKKQFTRKLNKILKITS